MSAASHGAAADHKRVFLHIGAPKTGTTFIQHVLFNNADRLAAAGVRYPYVNLGQSFRSAHDFCGTGWFGHPADRFQGEWDLVAQASRDWDGSTVILSSELLAAAAPDRIAKGLALLEPAELHIVYSARDLARQLVSDWQEHIKHKHTVTLERFVDDLAELGLDAPQPFGKLFWGMHDGPLVLANWSKVVPADRIHVLTVPQPGGQPDALWTRFCAITGLDPGGYDTTTKRANASMGVMEAELVRRMNLSTKRLDPRSYDAMVRLYLAERVLSGGTPRLTLPPERRAWARERSRVLIDELAAAGYPVEGDLDDLMPVEPVGDYVSPTDLTEADLGPAAIKAAAGLLGRACRLREQNARLEAALEAPSSTHARVLTASRAIAAASRRAVRGARRRLPRQA